MRPVRPALGPGTLRPHGRRPGNAPLPPALRVRPEPATATDPLARSPALGRVEAALLMADEPLAAKRLAEIAGLTDAGEARRAVGELQAAYDADGSAFQIESIAGGYQALSRPKYHPWLARLRRTGHDLRLASAAMEALSIVAYRQPIARADLEKLRGVACGEVVRQLMERGLVRLAGRDDSLGRPQLYGTTKKFLQAFGLNSLKDLPQVEALKPVERGEGGHERPTAE